ncbi:MAG: stage II sporulation protein M [Thermodesulfobacteriota bacterium]
MNIDEFVRERKGEWAKLEQISAKFRSSGRPDLTREELWELGSLYTGAISDLSVLKSSELAVDPGDRIIGYLNGLVIRVHGKIYRKTPFRWASLPEFFLVEFPSAFRESLVYVGLSTGIFLLIGLLGFVLGLAEPEFLELVVPDHIIATVERGEVWFKDLYTMAPQASSALMTHNISVTFLVFAAGITFGFGTVYLLAMNGLLIGCVGALCYKHELSIDLWSFVLPHGSVEISAVFIAGAAGLIIGHALLDPGPHKRLEHLALRSRTAIRLALGCVPLLMVAGIIEAFFSPAPIPELVKFIFALALFAGLLGFLFLSGNRPQE